VDEALAALVADWRHQGEDSFGVRREALKLSGLTAISLTEDLGGLDCSNRLLARLLRRMQALDTDAAEALHRHFVLIEHFRADNDERFYAQLAEQVLSGDLFFSETDTAFGSLEITQQDFHTEAAGALRLPQAALWADWLWTRARIGAPEAGHQVHALVPVRAGTFDAVEDGAGRAWLNARFRQAPVAHGSWEAKPVEYGTPQALDWLLQAVRLSVRLEIANEAPLSRSALRLDIARSALIALAEEAGEALDQAQVNPGAQTLDRALTTCMRVALFAAEIAGDEARFEALLNVLSALPGPDPGA
jgi:hypothetical protein